MHLRVRLVELRDPQRLQQLRQRYLQSLPEAQELLLEVMVPKASAYEVVTTKGACCGYLLVHSGHTLLEFHLAPSHWLFGEAVLLQAIVQLQLRFALVKSYDALLLSSAVPHHESIETLGLLVRDYVPRPLPSLSRIRYRVRGAEPSDLPRLVSVRQDVFDDRERLQTAVDRGLIRVFETPEGKIMGFGILRRVVPDLPHVDVGIALDVSFRGKGHAPYLLRELVEECRSKGDTPVCGCAADNLASRHMGERIGFVARHRLLKLRFKPTTTDRVLPDSSGAAALRRSGVHPARQPSA